MIQDAYFLRFCDNLGILWCQIEYLCRQYYLKCIVKLFYQEFFNLKMSTTDKALDMIVKTLQSLWAQPLNISSLITKLTTDSNIVQKTKQASTSFIKYLFQPTTTTLEKQEIDRKTNPNPLYLKMIYVFLLVVLSINWETFRGISPDTYSWFGCIWAIGVYRGLNKDQTSIWNDFFFTFWVRFAWSLVSNLASTGSPIPNTQYFMMIAIEALAVTILFNCIPLSIFESFWQNKVLRWFVFIFDQIAGGWATTAIFRKFILGEQLFYLPILLCIIRATVRPIMQIITGYFNNNLTLKTGRKWLKICYLNSARILLLLGINYVCHLNRSINQTGHLFGTFGQTMMFFNVAYFSMVGYLMYIETYY